MARGIGDNSIAKDALKGYVDRIEKLTEEKKELGADIRTVYGEAKGAGFDVKALRNTIRIRAADPATLEEEVATTNIYLRALGMPEIDLDAAGL